MKKLMCLVMLVTATACTLLTGAFQSRCGDGFLQNGETCDDGNRDAGDGCDAGCESEVLSPAATLVPEKADDVFQTYLTGTTEQEIFTLLFAPTGPMDALSSVPAKSLTLCWVDDETGLPPNTPLSSSLGLNDAAGFLAAPLVSVDVVTGCADIVLDDPFSLEGVGVPPKVFTVIGDIASAAASQHLVLPARSILGVDGEEVGNTALQTVGRLAYSGFPSCVTQNVADPTLVNQSGLPAADSVCNTFGEPVNVDAIQWNMVATKGQVGSINGFTVFKDGVGLAGNPVSCSAPNGVSQCLIFAPTADTLIPGLQAIYELRVDVAGAAGSQATQTWTLDPEGFAFSVSDGTHDGTTLLSGSATLSN